MAKEMGPRFEQRVKRRKINRMLNMAIAFVFILILFFGWQLLFADDHPSEQATQSDKKIEKKKNDDDHGHDHEKNVEVEIGKTEKPKEEVTEETTEETDEPEEKQEVIETAGDPSSNILKEIVNPSWQPVGTTQSEPHVTTFDESSVDWKEMLDAVSYATGLAQSDMIVWFIGNNGPNKAVATISTKDKSQYYKVYIEWVENQGWKPTKVQQLRQKE